MRLLIECTYVYEHPRDNSGIQRVVRNVIKQLGQTNPGVECIPVMMNKGQLYQVKSLAPLRRDTLTRLNQVLALKLGAAHHRLWHGYGQLLKFWPFHRSKQSRRALHLAFKLLSLVLRVPLGLAQWIERTSKPAASRATPMSAQPGDQLLLLDSSWHADFFPLAEKLREQGVGIVSVIYDLIPLTHPQFCDEGLVRVFDQWFDWIAKTADGFMAISQTISDQVAAEVSKRLGAAEAQKRWHGHFHLGSELDLATDQSAVLPQLEKMFQAPEPVYLMVSTIEPRKNHTYLLDAFELLWSQGSQARLCIIGKVGWKCEALVQRIRKHPEWEKRLFMFNKANDTSLEYAYSKAKALVFPSYVEGFGLPLVEAMQRGVPAMASDIPVFREIGGDFMAYFDLAEPASLARLIRQYDESGVFPAKRSLTEWHWLSWREATLQLIERTLTGLREQASSRTQPAVSACQAPIDWA